jgi:hypothetical protein
MEITGTHEGVKEQRSKLAEAVVESARRTHAVVEPIAEPFEIEPIVDVVPDV